MDASPDVFCVQRRMFATFSIANSFLRGAVGLCTRHHGSICPLRECVSENEENHVLGRAQKNIHAAPMMHNILRD